LTHGTVQKYGGSSVADAECMRRVAQRIRDTRDAGNQVVVVVSAMGDTTDDLIALAKQVNPDPNEREMDMLMATGEQISSPSCHGAARLGGRGSMTGHQAGHLHRRHAHEGQDPGASIRSGSGASGPGRVVIVAGLPGDQSPERTSPRWAAAGRTPPRWRWPRP
jgi:aspartate kinase